MKSEIGTKWTPSTGNGKSPAVANNPESNLDRLPACRRTPCLPLAWEDWPEVEELAGAQVNRGVCPICRFKTASINLKKEGFYLSCPRPGCQAKLKPLNQSLCQASAIVGTEKFIISGFETNGVA